MTGDTKNDRRRVSPKNTSMSLGFGDLGRNTQGRKVSWVSSPCFDALALDRVYLRKCIYSKHPSRKP